MKKLLLFTFLTALINQQAIADTFLELVSTWSNGKPTHSVAVRDSCAYVGTEDSLIVLDISDIYNPDLRKELSLGLGIVRDIALSGNYAYLGATSAGTHIINISEPFNPSFIYTWDPNSPPYGHGPYGIAVQGEYMYTAELHYGLRIGDISDPCLPKDVSRYQPDLDVAYVVVSGNYAYLAVERGSEVPTAGRIEVLDISDPCHPALYGQCPTWASPYGLALRDGYLYVANSATSGHGLLVCDISDPCDPNTLSECPTPGPSGCYRVAVSGNYAYLADAAEGLTVIDISDPCNPKLECNYPTAGNASSITVADGTVYLTQAGEGGVGLLIFRLITPVSIDIKPGSYPNAVNLNSQGLTPVAILSDIGFNAKNVDPASIDLSGAYVARRGKAGDKFMVHEEDVNGDGLVDLVVQIVTMDINTSLLTEENGVIYATLSGSTYDEQNIRGLDEITIVPPPATAIKSLLNQEISHAPHTHKISHGGIARCP